MNRLQNITQRCVQTALRRAGLSIGWLSSTPEGRLARLLRHYSIGLVIDVGANRGQFASLLRRDLGYRGYTVSFEPMKREFELMKRALANDTRWRGFHMGLGARSATALIHVAGNSASSSILQATTRLSQAAPQTVAHDAEEVQVVTLDSMMNEIAISEHETYLKIDAQGYERNVLAGAARSLQYIDTVQLEMELTAMYEGALPFHELLTFMVERGYQLAHVIPGLWDQSTGELLELDGIFRRTRDLG